MTNRRRIAAVCLALMGLGIVGEGVAVAQAIPPTPPGRENTPGEDDQHRPSHVCNPETGPGNRFREPGDGCPSK